MERDAVSVPREGEDVAVGDVGNAGRDRLRCRRGGSGGSRNVGWRKGGRPGQGGGRREAGNKTGTWAWPACPAWEEKWPRATGRPPPGPLTLCHLRLRIASAPLNGEADEQDSFGLPKKLQEELSQSL